VCVFELAATSHVNTSSPGGTEVISGHVQVGQSAARRRWQPHSSSSSVDLNNRLQRSRQSEPCQPCPGQSRHQWWIWFVQTGVVLRR